MHSYELALYRLGSVRMIFALFDLCNRRFHWDRLDENRERREIDHETPCGDVPLEYGAALEGAIFPAFLCSPFQRELRSGYFLNIIFDCPY